MATAQSEIFKQAFQLHKENKLDEAEALYLKIIEEDPQNAEVWDFLGIINMQKFKLGKAEEYIQKAIAINPDPYFYENLAKVYLEMEDAQKAIAIYSELLKYMPDSYNFVFNIAAAYKLAGNIDKAIEMYERAIEIIPTNPDAYHNLGLIYTDLGNPQKTIEYYKKAIKLTPDDVELQYFTSLAYFRNRDYKHGLPYFESRLRSESVV